jgi:hypothetical protein
MVAEQKRVASDSKFQARLRQLQSDWRERQQLPIGHHDGAPLGSRLEMPAAQSELTNYLTPTIRAIVHREIEREQGPEAQGKLYSEPRIFDDLLSSQPLCFNLFGELSADLALATEVCRLLWPERVKDVTSIEFEWSPGRGDARFLDNGSAFDVVLFHSCPGGGKGFIGIEVKYHENLKVKAATAKPRYDEVADTAGIFRPDQGPALAVPPLQQLWLDHLLALSMLQTGEWVTGQFVVMHPVANVPCTRAIDRYRSCLTDSTTFDRRALEEVVAAIRWASDSEWIRAFTDRYFGQ